MTARILVRLGADAEAVEKLRDDAERLGFEVREQARVGRLPIMQKPGFAERWIEIRPQVERHKISLREAARRLGCGVSTLHRLLHSTDRPHDAQTTSTAPVS